MNFDGFQPAEITRFSSLVEQEDPTNLPIGASTAARNVRFRLTGVRTRDGIQNQFGFKTGNANPITGGASLKLGGNPDVQIPMAYDGSGDLIIETPVGSGQKKDIVGPLVTLPPGSLQLVSAYKKAYLAFTNLKNSLASPAVYNTATGFLDPCSMKLVGQGWSPNTQYQIGECVTPSSPVGGNGFLYRCTVAGVSGANQPAFPIAPGAFVVDGGVTWQQTTPVMASSGLIGNICAGLRYMVVLFVNRNGYITGMTSASVVSVNIAAVGFKLFVGPIPQGPIGTQARICAFTPAGTLSQSAGFGVSSAGPYFWIPPVALGQTFDLTKLGAGVLIADVVDGISMTSTVVNDNVSGNATFNFTDDYLKSTELDISAYFRKIQVPPASDVYYSSTLKRMFYAVDTQKSGWYVSLLDDPESIYGDTSLIQVSENDSELRVAVREYAGVVYAMKERSGHVITPSADDPSKWAVNRQWSGSGPCGFRAVDVCTSFMCYVHRGGVYIFTGGQPVRISKEIPITWSQINWAVQETIWVMIDDESREIRIGVPYGVGVTSPNIILKCNYEESPSFVPPIHFSPFIGKEIATGECYKWSIDDIPANLAFRAERTLVNPPDLIDQATKVSQILICSSNPDGQVSAIIPFMFNDNGGGIDSYVETACHEDLLRPSLLGGVQANIDGKGQIAVEVLALRAKDPKQGGGKPATGTVIPLKKPCIAGTPYSCGASAQNERFRARVSNNKTPDVWFDLKYLNIWTRPIASAKAG